MTTIPAGHPVAAEAAAVAAPDGPLGVEHVAFLTVAAFDQAALLHEEPAEI